jgi:hypothetical protein
MNDPGRGGPSIWSNPMKKRMLSVLILSAGLLLFSSCLVLDLPWYTEGGYQAEYQKVVDLKPGGTIVLDNPAGDVEIRGWDRSEVEITARQEGGSSVRWGLFSGSSLRTQPRVSVETADNMVTIKSFASKDHDIQPVVHYEISVPESVNLKDIRIGKGSLTVGDVYGELAASIDDGDLVIENYSGSLDAQVGLGSVDAEVLDLRSEDHIKVTVRQGDINLSLERTAGAKLEAAAEAGEISSDFDLKSPLPMRKVTAPLGSGKALITLKVLKGNIRLEKTTSRTASSPDGQGETTKKGS